VRVAMAAASVQKPLTRWAMGPQTSTKTTFCPPGYGVVRDEDMSTSAGRAGGHDLVALKMKKAWEVSTSLISRSFMNLFMLWMAGSSLSIFTILMVSMAMWSAMSGALSVTAAFAQFQETEADRQQLNLLLPKLAYVAINLGLLGVSVYKCKSMCILPNSINDFLGYMPIRQAIEFAGHPVFYSVGA